jgi:hypothetical protein
MLSVCLCIPHYRIFNAEQIFMELGVYIMAPELSMVYFINPSRQSVCLYAYPLSLLGKAQ